MVGQENIFELIFFFVLFGFHEIVYPRIKKIINLQKQIYSQLIGHLNIEEAAHDVQGL